MSTHTHTHTLQHLVQLGVSGDREESVAAEVIIALLSLVSGVLSQPCRGAAGAHSPVVGGHYISLAPVYLSPAATTH